RENLPAGWLTEVGRSPFVPERAALERDLAQSSEACLFTDAIDHATTTATSKEHRVRTFQRFHTLDVIEVAIVLHVVAHSIQKEIRTRAITANDNLIAIVLALVRRDTRNISNNVRDVRHRLIANLLLSDNGDRLRNVAKRSQRLGSSGNRTNTVSVCDRDARA